MITVAGFILRISFFIGNKFPLHDGGFFFVLVKDILAAHFRLPEYSTYNFANIPFTYPPFGLYFVASLESVFGLDRLQLFRWVPLILSTLTIPAFFLLAKEITKDQRISLAATTSFSLLPMGYAWLILGGGVTRAFGAIFGIFALIFAIRFLRTGFWISGLSAAIFCGLTILSHPEWAWFVAYSIGSFCVYLFITKLKGSLIRSILLFSGTFLITLPWLITILKRYGISVIQPFLDTGFSRWGEIARFIFLKWTGEPLLPIFTFLAILGIFFAIKNRLKLLAVWLPLVFIFQGRAADQKAVIPLALLVGIGVMGIFDAVNSQALLKTYKKIITIFMCGIYLYSIVNSWGATASLAQALPDSFLESISWLKNNTPSDSKFLVISGQDWTNDNYSEWVSALSERESISVVQGYEWLPGFSQRIANYYQYQNKYADGIEELMAWIHQNVLQVDYLILPKTGDVALKNSLIQPALHWNDLTHFPGADLVFENEGALIVDVHELNR